MGGGDMPKISQGEDIDVESEVHKRNLLMRLSKELQKKDTTCFKNPKFVND